MLPIVCDGHRHLRAVRQPFPEGLLKVGDIVRVEIDGIGKLTNTIVQEPKGYVAPAVEESLAWTN